MAKENKLKEQIKQNLLEQLKLKNKSISYNIDLVESYMKQYDLREMLQADIDKYGLRIETTSGNGFKTSRANESVERLKKCNELMLNILNKLELTGEIVSESDDLNDYM